MKRVLLTLQLAAALSFVSFSSAEAQSEAPDEEDVAASPEVDPVLDEPAPLEEPEPQEPPPPEPALTDAAQPVAHAPQPPEDDLIAQDSATPQVRLRFRSIRMYAGAELQMAPIATPDSFRTMCELPCNTDADVGAYRLNVHRQDGRDYALPTSINFDGDTRISLKYGASTRAWVGGIVALTGVLGILISGGIAIAGAAGDDSGQTRGGLIGLGVSSVVFGAGLVTFLLSERGLRAEVLDSN